MNKTVTANIGGFVFNIEEHAYETLQRYLTAIRNKMAGEEGVDEVMQDIEGRIAEIFQEKLNEFKIEVIGMTHVEGVIEIMGEPEAYGDGEPSSESAGSKTNYEENSTNRQIFRDPDEKIVGGVCSGLAAYMGWDPIILRLIFVLLFFGFGTGFFLYLVLWIIIPEAQTASDRLRMRGQKVNVENIKDKFKDIRNEFEGTGKETGKKIKSGIHQLVQNFAETFGNIARIFTVILAALMFVGAIAILFLLLKMMLQSEIIYVFTDDTAYSITYEELEQLFFTSAAQANIGYLGFVLLLTSIAISLILGAVKLIFKVKIPLFFKILTGTSSTVSVILIIICTTYIGYDFSKDAEYSEQIKLENSSDTLYLDTFKDDYFSDNLEYNDDILFETVKIKDDKIIFGYPELKIKRGYTDEFEVTIEREAHGSNKREALSRAEALHYPIKHKDSLLTLAPYFSTPIKNKLRLQKVTITLFVPEGKTIYFGKNINRIYNPCDTSEEDEESITPVNTYLEMTEEGLRTK